MVSDRAGSPRRGGRPRARDLRPHRAVALSLFLGSWSMLLAACDGEATAPSSLSSAATATVTRDIDLLQAIKRTPQACEVDAQCPAGSHCDSDAGTCDWSCLADSDCGASGRCDAVGTCRAASPVSTNVASDTPACQAIPFAERRAVLLALNDEQRLCADDEDCPCGAYCASDATCRVECMAEEPDNDDLFCPAGQSCTPLGRCADSPDEPPPPIELDLEVAPELLSANTALAAAELQAEVTIIATSLEVLEPEHPARVFIGFAERTDPDQITLPEVKCASSGAYASSCELDGGWVFDISSGSLRSQPRQVWIRIPQLAAPEAWMLEARSEWADLAATAVVRAEPVVHPATGVGEYAGTLTWPQPEGSEMALDVTATVTATHVALFERTRMLMPEGHMVLARNQSLATLLRWLQSDATGGLRVRFDLGPVTYAADDGHLTAPVELRTHRRTIPLALDLRRTGDVAAAICTATDQCAAGTYCNIDAGLCLPGGAAPVGAIVSDGAAGDGDTSMPSAQKQAWMAPLGDLVAQNSEHLGGTDIIGLERAYCYRAGQSFPGRFIHKTVEPSLDLACDNASAAGTGQRTFRYANRTTEVTADGQGGETFNLLDTCIADLGVQPTGPVTLANLLAEKACVSLGRFFLALRAGATEPAGPRSQYMAGQSLFGQILRQWLAVNAFVARASAQEQQYDDVLGSGGLAAHERLGAAVDLVDRGWRVLLDPTVRASFVGAFRNLATIGPEYRRINRPALHWSFNAGTGGGRGADSENDFDLNMTGTFPNPAEKAVYVESTTNGSCKTDRIMNLPDRSFSVVGYVGTIVEGKFTLFQGLTSIGETRQFWIDVEWHASDPNEVIVEARSANGGVARFVIPQAQGYYAFVADGSKYRLYRVGTTLQEFVPTVQGGGPIWGTSATIRVACDLPKNGENEPLLIFDEVSVWGRPLQPKALQAMAAGYFNSSGVAQFEVDTLPPLAPGDIAIAPGQEQAVGLAIHLLEAASAHADLLAAYTEAERGVMYDECYLGGTSVARERLLDRAGRGLRLITLLEGDAAAVIQGIQLPWISRYRADQAEFAGKRRKVVDAIRLAESCTNPLGVTEDDLPLYHGNAVGASERFFASSRFLTQKAREEIDAATGELDQARDAYWQQRLSAFQVTLSQTEKNERLRKLKLDYEGVLRRHCGARAGNEPFLPDFLDGTLSVGSCIFKTELPGCQNAAALPIRDVPARCLRGEVGAHVLAIQAAAIDVTNASKNYRRAVDQYAAEGAYCARRQAIHTQSEEALRAHQKNMRDIQREKDEASWWGGLVKGIAHAATGNIGGALEALESRYDQVLNMEAQRERDSYLQFVQVQEHRLDMEACYRSVDNYHVAKDAARDVIVRAVHDADIAIFNFNNARDEVAALLDEAVGQIEVESELDRTPPHHHFWLDDHIDVYRRHLRYARRLTYLALRSFEYESQQSIGLRGQVLSARHPDSLLQVVEAIEQRNAPMQGEQGFVIGETGIVLSLRDEILRILDLANTGDLEPGDPPISAEEAFRRYLRSGSARIYDRAGNYLGQGMRFVLRPDGWSQTSCAERTWRLTTSIQMVGTLNNPQMVLLQENAFASQKCRAQERGELRVARIRPNHNLLVGETSNFDEPSQYTAMNVDGLINRSRQQMEDMAEGQHAGFAGRGLYGNYVLLFPSQMFPDPVLANIKDVLIRFDIVEVTNVDL